MKRAPYQKKSPEHPSMQEVPVTGVDVLKGVRDPYADIDPQYKEIDEKRANKPSDAVCVIGTDEQCTGCRTCIRLGF